MSSCQEIKDLVYRLMEEPELKDKIYVAGGSVAWILSDSESGRDHSDIDIVADSQRKFPSGKGLCGSYGVKSDRHS